MFRPDLHSDLVRPTRDMVTPHLLFLRDWETMQSAAVLCGMNYLQLTELHFTTQTWFAVDGEFVNTFLVLRVMPLPSLHLSLPQSLLIQSWDATTWGSLSIRSFWGALFGHPPQIQPPGDVLFCIPLPHVSLG